MEAISNFAFLLSVFFMMPSLEFVGPPVNLREDFFVFASIGLDGIYLKRT
jgi:hypothetical protein